MSMILKIGLRLTAIVLLVASFCYAQQSSIHITEPSDGTLVTGGQTITITVSADSSVEVVGVLTDGSFPNMQVGSLPNQFLQVIPKTTRPRIYHLTAIGVSSDEVLNSEPISILVEPQDFPIALDTDPVLLDFESVGDTLPIYVTGTFWDDSTLDVSHSSRTSYTSKNPQIATVDSKGAVTAVAPGTTFILISTTNPDPTISKPYAAIMVTVRTPKPSGTPPAITNVSPDHGIPGVTQVTVTGAGFGAQQGSGELLLGTREAQVISSWTDTQITATIPAESETGLVGVDQNGLQSNDLPFTITTPFVTGINPSSVSPDMQMTIEGGSFGVTQESGTVTLGSIAAPVVSWADDQVVVTVPLLASRLLSSSNNCVRTVLAQERMPTLSSVRFGTTSETTGAVMDLQEGVSDDIFFPIAYIAGRASQENLLGLDCYPYPYGGGRICKAFELRTLCGNPLVANPLASSLTSDGWPAIFNNAPNDAIVPVNSQMNIPGDQTPDPLRVYLGVIHSQGTEELDFFGPNELESSSGIPDALVDLLNENTDGNDFKLKTVEGPA